jgi:hypothetical protein
MRFRRAYPSDLSDTALSDTALSAAAWEFEPPVARQPRSDTPVGGRPLAAPRREIRQRDPLRLAVGETIIELC